jgi:hypothetical protein
MNMTAYEEIKPYLEKGATVPITPKTVAALIFAIKELEKQLQNQAMDAVVKVGQEIDAMPDYYRWQNGEGVWVCTTYKPFRSDYIHFTKPRRQSH